MMASLRYYGKLTGRQGYLKPVVGSFECGSRISDGAEG